MKQHHYVSSQIFQLLDHPQILEIIRTHSKFSTCFVSKDFSTKDLIIATKFLKCILNVKSISFAIDKTFKKQKYSSFGLNTGQTFPPHSYEQIQVNQSAQKEPEIRKTLFRSCFNLYQTFLSWPLARSILWNTLRSQPNINDSEKNKLSHSKKMSHNKNIQSISHKFSSIKIFLNVGKRFFSSGYTPNIFEINQKHHYFHHWISLLGYWQIALHVAYILKNHLLKKFVNKICQQNINAITFNTMETSRFKLLLHEIHVLENSKHLLFQKNIPLALLQAQKYANVTSIAHNIEDLRQESLIGLLQALERYNSTKGFFSSYSLLWIKQSIIRSITNKKNDIKIPGTLLKEYINFKFDVKNLTQELHRKPSDCDITCNINISPQKLLLFENLHEPSISLEHNHPNGQPLIDVLENTQAMSPEKKISQQWVKQSILNLLQKHLSPRENFVISARFGLHNQYKLSLKELGTQLSLTRERIRQIEKKALSRLSEIMQYQNILEYIDC